MEVGLIVRVKRRRDEGASETLCVIEDDTPKRKQLASSSSLIGQFESLLKASDDGSIATEGKLETVPVAPEKSTRLLLTRVDTISTKITDIDAATISAGASRKKRKDIEDESAVKSTTTLSNPVLITNSKKTMKVEASGNIVLVDMSQVSSATHSSSSIQKPSPTKILNPATRKLDMAITSAFKTGNFVSIMEAISLGADVNYQTSIEAGRRSILMCAALHCNTRMVKQLLARSIDVLAEDAHGKTAMDYANRAVVPSNQVESKIDIQQWLYRAAVKQHQKTEQDRLDKQSRKDFGLPEGSTLQNLVAEPTDGDDYVYDIYCALPSAQVDDTKAAGAGAFSSDAYVTGVELAGQDNTENAPVVCIEGLRFTDTGAAELVFEYDSDWSDLADDEEVDSNDERYEGNDYPDEEADEPQFQKLDDDDDDFNEDEEIDNRGRNIRAEYGAREFLRNSSNQPSKRSTSGNMPSRQYFGENYGVDNGDDDEAQEFNYHDDFGSDVEGNDYDDVYDEGFQGRSRLPDFERMGVGHVVRPGYIGGDANCNDGDFGMRQEATKQYLQQLWGEEDDLDSALDDGAHGHQGLMAHQQRVAAMRSRTGMDFASNVREFDQSGLAKYGAELVEEEDDMIALESTLMPTEERLEVARQVARLQAERHQGGTNAPAVTPSQTWRLSEENSDSMKMGSRAQPRFPPRASQQLSNVAYDSELDGSCDEMS